MYKNGHENGFSELGAFHMLSLEPSSTMEGVLCIRESSKALLL